MLVVVNGIKLELDNTKHYALTVLDDESIAVYEFKNEEDVMDEDASPNLAFVVEK